MQSIEYLIAGAGIMGLTMARELVRSGTDSVLIIEKEPSPGMHASGRNSGVLHAGIYYGTDSLKARFCLNGNFMMKEFCREKGLRLVESGKVIVAKNSEELRTLRQLHDRAVKNGAKVELIDEKQLSDIEPNAKTCGTALLSHYTAIVDPKEILKSLEQELVASGRVKFLFNTRFKELHSSNSIMTDSGEIRFERFVNSAGAYADKVAHAFGVGLDYRVQPFKGLYRHIKKERSGIVNGNIYPVPDARNPFLGVHFTKSASGDVYLGPTAIPALGRENYGILKGADSEAVEILCRDILLFITNPGFRKVALTEPRKYMPGPFYRDSKELVKELSPEWIQSCDKVGIRPQLVDWSSKDLVMDFVVIKDGASVHILNAISPAFTSSMAFARFIVENYINKT